jgi:hypothetical protein
MSGDFNEGVQASGNSPDRRRGLCLENIEEEEIEYKRKRNKNNIEKI